MWNLPCLVRFVTLWVRSNNSVSITKSGDSWKRKTVKRASRDVDTQPPNPPTRAEIDGQYTAKPEIAETFIPLPYRFPPHDPKPKVSGNPHTAYDFFSQFWDEEVFAILVANTNEYAAKLRGPAPPPGFFSLHPWRPVTIAEMKKFIGQLIFMSLHGCKSVVEYWRQVKRHGRIWRVENMLSLLRFQQIKRYLHVEPVQIEGRSDSEWWKKIEPLHLLLQKTAFRVLWSLVQIWP